MPARHRPQQRRPKTGKKLCRLPSGTLPTQLRRPRRPLGPRPHTMPHLRPRHSAPCLPPPCDTSRLTTTPALSSDFQTHPLPGTPEVIPNTPPVRHTRPIPRPFHTPSAHPPSPHAPPPAHPSYRPGQTASSARTAEAEDIRKNFNKILKNLPVSYSRPNRPVFRQPEAKNDRGIRYCHLKPKQGARKISRGGRKIPSAVNNLTINLYICDIVFKPH